MKVGILRETRRWEDRRVAITPQTAQKIKEQFPHVELLIQKSDIRVHPDEAYEKAGFMVVDDVFDCDLLIGVKEVANEALIEGKTYMMFAHVAKKQEHNRVFMQEMIRKKITLIDYEYLTDKKGNRVVAFGFWAGVVGAYYAFQGIARRFMQKEIPAPNECRDMQHLKEQVGNINWPAQKIVVTGGGRVASGAIEIIESAGVKQVSPDDFLNKEYDYPVYTKLDPDRYVKRINGEFDLEHFFAHPEEYTSTFKPYTQKADIYIACHFWNPKSPVFFTAEEMKSDDFKISLIADVSCDIPGPVPSTIRSSIIDAPFYDIDPKTNEEKPAFSSSDNITVMAVDNLPTALPFDASYTFSLDLLERVFPSLFVEDKDGIVERATILKNGELTSKYSYLEDFAKKA